MRQKITIVLNEEELKRLDRYRAQEDYNINREEAVRQIVLQELEGMDGLDLVPSEFDPTRMV